MTRTVLYVIDSLGLSGKTLGLVNLALGLDPARYRPAVASFAPLEGSLVERLRDACVPTFHIPCADGVKPLMASRLGKLHRELSPAVVHCFNPRPMLYGGLTARLFGRPAIGSLSAFACLRGDREYAFLPQPLHTSSRRNRIRNRILDRLIRRFATISQRAAEAFCEVNRVQREKVHVIGYGVDLDSFDRVDPETVARTKADLGCKPGEILVGSVGRLVEQKDYPTQLRALALVGNRAPIRMILVGDGPLGGELRQLATELGVADRVTWLGERRDVGTLLRTFDAFVLASKFEPFGVALLEAMAARLPIVATAVNEVPEILEHGRAGMLVPAAQPQELADALVEVANDTALATRLGARARTAAETRYSLATVRTNYQALYDDVLEEARR